MSDINPAALRKATDKYAPRLDFRTRAAIYALYHHKGVARGPLATAFGLARITVAHITDTSERYKSVKAKCAQMGLEAFYTAYVTESDILSVNSTLAAQTPLKPKQSRIVDASDYEGQHVVNGITVDIQYLGYDNGRRDKKAGWYWRMWDSAEFNGIPARAGETSAEVYKFLEENLRP
jgi:hypothetical protein